MLRYFLFSVDQRRSASLKVSFQTRRLQLYARGEGGASSACAGSRGGLQVAAVAPGVQTRADFCGRLCMCGAVRSCIRRASESGGQCRVAFRSGVARAAFERTHEAARLRSPRPASPGALDAALSTVAGKALLSMCPILMPPELNSSGWNIRRIAYMFSSDSKRVAGRTDILAYICSSKRNSRPCDVAQATCNMYSSEQDMLRHLRWGSMVRRSPCHTLLRQIRCRRSPALEGDHEVTDSS